MFDVHAVRARFPALTRAVDGRPVAYFDGPGGTQVPASVIEAIGSVLGEGVSNLGGGFASSLLAETVTDEARGAVADLFGVPDGSGVFFGQNMTSLTMAMSRAMARTWRPGDRVVVSDLDHDANVTPWVLAAEDRGVAVDVARFDPQTFRLDVEAVERVLTDRTRLVAVTHASNALGTIPDVEAIVSAAHRVGAIAYVDAVHYAPHGVIDAAETGADVVVASAYKFFGPHTGAVYGRPDLLEELSPYKVRPAPSHGPGRWETGTQSFEALAGVTAAVEHLASLGDGPGRRDRLVDAHGVVDAHLRPLVGHFLESLPGSVRLYGVPGVEGRTPTFALRVAGEHPAATTARLAGHGLYTWSGHYYAVEPMRRLGLLDDGGAVRVGFVHTTTREEVDRLLDVLA